MQDVFCVTADGGWKIHSEVKEIRTLASLMNERVEAKKISTESSVSSFEFGDKEKDIFTKLVKKSNFLNPFEVGKGYKIEGVFRLSTASFINTINMQIKGEKFLVLPVFYAQTEEKEVFDFFKEYADL